MGLLSCFTGCQGWWQELPGLCGAQHGHAETRLVKGRGHMETQLVTGGVVMGDQGDEGGVVTWRPGW